MAKKFTQIIDAVLGNGCNRRRKTNTKVKVNTRPLWEVRQKRAATRPMKAVE